MSENLGIDLALLHDFPAGFELASGRRNLAYACARRLDTRRGSLIRDDDYGEDMREELNAEVEEYDLRQIESKARAELLKEPRVESVNVDATYNFSRQSLDLSITIDDGDGPFTFILSISTLTIDLLFDGEPPMVVAAAPTPVTLPIIGEQGPPGPAGAPGAAGGFSGFELSVDDDGEHYVVGTAETIIGHAWLVDLLGAPANLTAALWMSSMVNTGTGTIRLRIGGSETGIDGTIVASATVTSTSFSAKTASGPYTNPTGQVWVKVTAMSNGTSDRVYVRRPTVLISG